MVAILDYYIWNRLYTAINPFTIAAYLLGLVVLLQYIIYDNIVLKVLITIFYGWIMLMSLVAIMGIIHWWELSIYLPHIIIIILCIWTSVIKWRSKHEQDESN